jgi:hypothetical protein
MKRLGKKHVQVIDDLEDSDRPPLEETADAGPDLATPSHDSRR